MLKKLKERKNLLIADFVSVIAFMSLSGFVASFFDPKYLSLVFFCGGIFHGKLSAPLEKALVKKLGD